MTSTAVETDPTLQPVPGAEGLRWVGDPLSFTIRPRWNTLPCVLAIGGTDAALVHLAQSDRGEVLLSRRLDGAFDRWPPVVGDPVEQVRRDFGNSPPQIVAWPGGRFALGSHGGLFGRWDTPAPPQDGRAARSYPAPDGSLYVELERGGVGVIEHRAGADLERVTPVGPRPPRHRSGLRAVTDGGTLWLAQFDNPPPAGLEVPTHVDFLRGVPGELRACGHVTCPTGLWPERLLGRADGGAWLVLQGTAGAAVQGIDAEGNPTGSLWHLPFAQHFRGERVFASWRNGFIVFTRAKSSVLLLSDGVHTTRVQGPIGGEPSINRYPSLVASPDGRSILVAHQTKDGLQVARADVSALEPAREGDVLVDPWAADRLAMKARDERVATVAANPPPPRLPGQPVESSDDAAPVLHSRARFVSQVRLHATVTAISAIHYSAGSRFQGDAETGTYLHMDGCGNHVAFAWGPEGVVAIAFDHDMNEEAGMSEEDWKPERHFGKVPASLAPVVERAIAIANRQVTGAIWISAGPEPRWSDVGLGTEMLAGFARTAEETLFGDALSQSWRELSSVSEEQARLAILLSQATTKGSRRVITLAEEKVLFAPPPESQRDVPGLTNVARAVAMFAQVGIDWPDAVEHAKALGEQDEDRGYALLDAVERKDLEAVRKLLGEGANLEKRSRPGQLGRRWSHGGATPLLLALTNREVELSRILLEAGANPSEIVGGYSPLTAAASAGSRELCELLLKHGADLERVRGNVFYAAVDGRQADVVELFLDLGVESGMSLGWYERFVAVATACNRPDLLVRLPEPEHVKAARARMDERPRASARRFKDDARRYLRLRHVLLALRGIHAEVEGSSVFEGTHEEGRNAWADGAGGGQVVAWNEHGIVAWAFDPQRSPDTVEGAAPADSVAVAFAGAPPALRELATSTAGWSLAPTQVTDAYWVFPAAAALADLQGMWGGHPSSFVPHGESATSAMDARGPGWPREARELRPELATRAFQMSRLSILGDFPAITETDEALMLEAPPRRKAAKVRPEGVAAAARLLGQIGIAWPGAVERATRR